MSIFRIFKFRNKPDEQKGPASRSDGFGVEQKPIIDPKVAEAAQRARESETNDEVLGKIRLLEIGGVIIPPGTRVVSENSFKSLEAHSTGFSPFGDDPTLSSRESYWTLSDIEGEINPKDHTEVGGALRPEEANIKNAFVTKKIIVYQDSPNGGDPTALYAIENFFVVHKDTTKITNARQLSYIGSLRININDKSIEKTDRAGRYTSDVDSREQKTSF